MLSTPINVQLLSLLRSDLQKCSYNGQGQELNWVKLLQNKYLNIYTICSFFACYALMSWSTTSNPPFHVSSPLTAAHVQNLLFERALAQGPILAHDSTQQLQNISTASLTAINQQITSLAEAVIQILHTQKTKVGLSFLCVFLYWNVVLCLWNCLVENIRGHMYLSVSPGEQCCYYIYVPEIVDIN